MRLFLLKQIVLYYVDRGTPVLSAFLVYLGQGSPNVFTRGSHELLHTIRGLQISYVMCFFRGILHSTKSINVA